MGRLADLAGWSERELTDPPTSVTGLIARLAEEWPDLGAELAARTTLVARNMELIRGDISLAPGDEVAFMPPLSGG